MTTYSEKLKDPRWRKRRLEILEIDKYKCRKCGTNDETLNVHHLCYIKDREPWEYWNNQLVTLCQVCHVQVHSEIEFNKAIKIKSSRIKDIRSLKELIVQYSKN